jgi:SagB-type dehydrogenase family enzyme
MARRQPVPLPEPKRTGKESLEKALQARRSIRDYRAGSLTCQQIGQLLWSAQGITQGDGGRAAPSAGATYPLEVDLVVGDVELLEAGVYRFRPAKHDLVPRLAGDVRAALAEASLGQEWVRECAAVIVLSAVFGRTTRRYDKRGIRYVHMEIGHAAQNVYLQATVLGLGTVFVGAFEDRDVAKALDLPKEEEPLCLLPVGRVR